MKTVLGILKNEFVGKILIISNKIPIKEQYIEDVKKSANVTNKQFESGNPKYRMKSTKTRIIGYEDCVRKSKIVDIFLMGDYDGEVSIIIETEDGLRESFHDNCEINFK